jgi:hypothetical protein
MVPSYHQAIDELVRESRELQPWRPNEFNQRSAAIHEASHCVVAAREGLALKSAQIKCTGGVWLGDFWLDWPEGTLMSLDMNTPEFLAHLRITLAGRRGELLFLGDDFCLRAGLDELAYASLMILPALVFQAQGNEATSDELYGPLWETTLAEVDEALLALQAEGVGAWAEAILHGRAVQERACG